MVLSINQNWKHFEIPIQDATIREGCWDFNDLDSKNSDIDSLLIPKNFVEVHQFKAEKNDSISGFFLVKHASGIYIYFECHCDWTLYEAIGGGSVTVSKDLSKLQSLFESEQKRK